MNTKPKARCPRCGSRYTVIDAGLPRNTETAEWYAECDCGAATLTVTGGKVARITFCDPDDGLGSLYDDGPAGPEDEDWPEYIETEG